MSKRDRLSRDQKRKAKLKKRAERSHKHEGLAYSGKKYRTEELAPIFLQTETGIYETFVILDRQLTDDVVESAIERLVLLMRQGTLPPPPEIGIIPATEDDEDLVITNIRRGWEDLRQQGRLPGRDDLIGVLRTILHSIEFWRSKGLHSQGYLRFIEDFLKQVGVSVRLEAEEVRRLPEPDNE